MTATQISQLTKVSRPTINRIWLLLRKRLADRCYKSTPFKGEVELDESYFGAKRQKGKRGRGAYGKTIVLGIEQRNGIVYTQLINNCSKATLQQMIVAKVDPATIVHTDGWQGYRGAEVLQGLYQKGGYIRTRQISYQWDRRLLEIEQNPMGKV